MSANTLHLYLCPPCLLKAHARATTCPVALLATGTQSMEKILYPNMVDSCWHSSCRQERVKYNFDIVKYKNTWSKKERSKADPYSSDVLKSDWLLFFHNLTKVSKCKLGRRDSMQEIKKYRTVSAFQIYWIQDRKTQEKCPLLIAANSNLDA